jgi:hypothetical protein
MTRTRMMEITDYLFVGAVAVLLLLPQWPASYGERIRKLGEDKLGETVKDFLIHHPKAACGRSVSIEINSRTLVNSGDMEFIHCCLNDRDSLAEILPFPILNLDDCAFHATFWKRRLDALYYRMDVRSVKAVLPTFEEFYGPPDRVFWDQEDSSKLTFADWARGGTYLDVWLVRMDGNEDSKDAKGKPRLETVCVRLFDVDLIPDRK